MAVAGCNTASADTCDELNVDVGTFAEDAGDATYPSSSIDPNWVGEWWQDLYSPSSFQNSAYLIASARCGCLSYGNWPGPDQWRWGDLLEGLEACEAELEEDDWWLQHFEEEVVRHGGDQQRLYALACVAVERGVVAECYQDMQFDEQCDYDAYRACQASLESIEERCGGYER